MSREPLIGVHEAARRLGVSARTLYRLSADGRIPRVTIYGIVRFRVADVEALASTVPAKWLTAKQVARMVSRLLDDDVSIDRVWRAARSGKLRVAPSAGNYRIEPAAVEQWVREGAHAGPRKEVNADA